MQPRSSTDALKLMLLKRGHHMKINRIAMTSAVVLHDTRSVGDGAAAIVRVAGHDLQHEPYLRLGY